MPPRKKTPTDRIEVIDQVGKRHVVVRYTERLDASPEQSNMPGQDEIATEYRLTTGRIVDKTGADTFQTVDGMLRLKAV